MVKPGEPVLYTDEQDVNHHALVTVAHSEDCINLVYVRDGRPQERTSVPHLRRRLETRDLVVRAQPHETRPMAMRTSGEYWRV